jgi:hypothetical protein
MTLIRTVTLLAGGLLIGGGNAAAETADCRAQLKRQDEQCQMLAEKLAAACPSGTNIKETADCHALSTEIANTCTRKPCAPPPRKGRRAKSKSKGMGAGMGAAKGMGAGETRSQPAKKAAPTSK